MTDIPPIPPDNNNEETSSISAEFEALGKNIVTTLQAALNSEESKKLQREIENGMNEMSANFKKAMDDFSQSQTGQQLKSDLADLNQRITSGELQTKVRTEVLTALRTANVEIQKAAAKFSSSSDENDTPPDTSA